MNISLNTKNFFLFILIILLFPLTIFAQVSPEERARLEAELKSLEEESAKIQTQLNQKKGQRASLERDLSILATKIAASKNTIKKLDLTINKIAVEIDDREDRINELGGKINQNKEYITNALLEIRKLDDVRATIALSKNAPLSEVFVDRESYIAIQNSLSSNVDNLKNNKKFVEVEKDVLEDKKDENVELKRKQESEKKKVEASKQQTDTILTITKGEEKEYSKVLAEKQKQIASIKSRLFTLRDTGGITFDKAQTYAKAASKATGVRAALILGILKQESNLGSNVGRCYLTDSQTGNGINITTQKSVSKVMSPTRDVPPFLSLMQTLGRDPYKTRISCPVPGIGWGGAMGPTQFIPSTWVRYQSRVSALTGTSADPWNAYDAIFATALYLADSGASAGGTTAERNAACRYYSGRSCAGNSAGSGYANSVLNHADNFQKDIDLINE